LGQRVEPKGVALREDVARRLAPDFYEERFRHNSSPASTTAGALAKPNDFERNAGQANRRQQRHMPLRHDPRGRRKRFRIISASSLLAEPTRDTRDALALGDAAQAAPQIPRSFDTIEMPSIGQRLNDARCQR